MTFVMRDIYPTLMIIVSEWYRIVVLQAIAVFVARMRPAVAISPQCKAF